MTLSGVSNGFYYFFTTFYLVVIRVTLLVLLYWFLIFNLQFSLGILYVYRLSICFNSFKLEY